MSTSRARNPMGPSQQTSPPFRRQSVASLLPRKAMSNGSSSGDGHSGEHSGAKIHTLTACNRCRSRKSRCDASLPKCEPCQRSGSQCDFWDASKGIVLSRSYVIFLQDRVKALDQEIKQLEKELPPSSGLDDDDLVRSMGMVSLADEEPERHFLGSSAGLQLARLVVEFAKKNTVTHSVKEIVPPTEHEPARFQGKERRASAFALSSAPIDKLPKRELTDKLVSEFIFKRAQFMLPTLHEDTFMKDADEVYAGSTDPHKNFIVKMVLAISMQKIGSQYSGLADGFYLSALTHLEAVVGAMNLSTLQCFCLMGQYSLLTPTRTGIYHIIGLATRLCIDLGLNQESTITKDIFGNPLDPLTIDMRRRLFWVTSSMESGLSHILGRPSGFCTGDTFTDVQFFQPYDDNLITKDGILPGPVSTKKLISMHFFRMRRIQSEIRLGLYQNLRDTPKDDQDPWFKQMHAKLDQWVNNAPGNETSGLSQEWFRHRYNNMLIFLYRPSPQIPKPSLDATILCYDCAIKNINIQKKMFDERSVDMTWVLVHQVYMTCIIMMWCLSYEDIRKRHPRHEVAKHIQTGLECMDMMVERWPGVGSAREIFWRLSIVALQSYETTSQVVDPLSTLPPSTGGPPPTTQAAVAPQVQKASAPTRTARNSSATPPHGRSPPHTPPSYSPASFHTTPSSRLSMPSNASIGSHHASMDAQINGSFTNSAPIMQYLNQAFDNNNNTQYGIISQSPPPRMHSQSPSASSGYYGSNSPSSDFNNPPTPGTHTTDDITPRPSVSNYPFEAYSINQQQPMDLTNNRTLSEDMGISPQTVLPSTYPVSLQEISSYPAPNPVTGLPTISEDPAAPFASSFPGDQMFNFYPSSDVTNLLNWTTSGHGQMDVLSGNPYASNTYRMDVIDQQQANALMMSLENDSQGTRHYATMKYDLLPKLQPPAALTEQYSEY